MKEYDLIVKLTKDIAILLLAHNQPLFGIQKTLIGLDLTIKKFKIIDGIENKLSRFQIYPETEIACKYPKPFFKTQYSKTLVEYEKSFGMKTGKLYPGNNFQKHRKYWRKTSPRE